MSYEEKGRSEERGEMPMAPQARGSRSDHRDVADGDSSQADRSGGDGPQPGGSDSVDAILALYRRVDAFFDAAQAAQPDQVVCKPGCSACCHVDLGLFGIEADLVRQAFARLDPAVQVKAGQRAAEGRHCAMLDDDGRCIVYEDRPLICRSHGLAVDLGERLDHCPLNYASKPPEPEHVLSLDVVNEVLVVANRLYGASGSRIRIADIVLEE
ncbi:MAG: YkgJ family cysteine cluster protein [Deltaproteobacteria bacterium]|nr:YkgJ family cysteine cluster protein [Deltaproteobacteria bacterium]